MRWSVLAAPLLILAIDQNPVTVAPDSSGHYRVTLGGSFGQYEGRSLDCDGHVVNSWTVQQRALGAEIEAWPTPKWRLSAWAGREGPDLEITTGGVLLAREWRHFGFGGGVARVISTDYVDYLSHPAENYAQYPDGEYDWYPDYKPASIIPSFYVRGGPLDGIHVRVEVGPPGPLGSAAGIARLGVAGNQGWREGLRWQAGLSIAPTADEAYPLGAYWQGDFPLGRGLELRSMAALRPADSHLDGNLGLGIRWSPGRP